MHKIRYWLKMNILEGTCSWITKCDHIGEAKLFGYILATMNRTDGLWTNTKQKRLAVEQLYGLKEASQFNYMKNLVKNGLLLKKGKGEYQVNKQYVSYGKDEQTHPK
ncbi:hypothetical protein [Spirosoma sordidisoli]|uniref:Uncharacterized protein n=1 Tax=Spirosoma sordidisoli TaxID=2502893 RepID=A0A4Q2UM80_9BACT|nr:hypothetical protein [Spirosoma sordidisoli]RYC70703.1 hypothetical protein EQG79_00695 [Spirosoma sordidisoli]